jgi:hypothetical protein
MASITDCAQPSTPGLEGKKTRSKPASLHAVADVDPMHAQLCSVPTRSVQVLTADGLASATTSAVRARASSSSSHAALTVSYVLSRLHARSA